jgi:hypothetical protein
MKMLMTQDLVFITAVGESGPFYKEFTRVIYKSGHCNFQYLITGNKTSDILLVHELPYIFCNCLIPTT